MSGWRKRQIADKVDSAAKLNFLVGRIHDGQQLYNLIRAHTSGEAVRIAAAKGGRVVACRQL